MLQTPQVKPLLSPAIRTLFDLVCTENNAIKCNVLVGAGGVPEEGQSGRMTIYTRAGTSWGDLISDKNEAIPSLHHRHTLPMLDIECKLLWWVVINRDSINVQSLR